MSISEIYHIATIAKEKLLCEAEHKDHNLARIVHHAQLYDMLLEKYQEEEDREEAAEEKGAIAGQPGQTDHFEWIVDGESSGDESEPSDDDWDSDAESTSAVESGDAKLLDVQSKPQQGSVAVVGNEHYSVVEVFEIELDEEDD